MWLDWGLALDMATHTETKGVIQEVMNFATSCGLALSCQSLAHFGEIS